MWGLFGLATCKDANLKQASKVLKMLSTLSESRGGQASGLAFQDNDKIHILKSPKSFKVLQTSNEFSALEKKIDICAEKGLPFFVTGHTRPIINNKSNKHENNQPVIKDELICFHGGLVTNDNYLWQKHKDLNRLLEVDSEVIISLVNRFCQEGETLNEAVKFAFEEIGGANSFVIISPEFKGAVFATSNGSLYWATSDKGVFTFASERYALENAIKNSSLKYYCTTSDIQKLKPDTGCIISIESDIINVNIFSFKHKTVSPMLLKSTFKKMEIIDHSSLSHTKISEKVPVVASTSYKSLESLCRFDVSEINKLRRCSRCLLPETFPFISFDENGVCNYCANYSSWENRGIDQLNELVEPMRKLGSEPDCLVPISGGRDSSYALHFVKNVLKMNPIAYTYDWGMVTDLARRNISRMCGALGVEHILISANIKKKLGYVRQNVLAWLKRPHLGTVSLFMAGDKPFFYYSNLLCKQLRLRSSILGMNNLERTDFKVGFCGIDENFKKQQYYRLQAWNKLRLLMFFGGQFLKNPRFINSSFLDSLKGFISYYFVNKDYIPLYDYIRWDEDMISNTLINEYGWEVAEDTKTTWRIGDGTASFYNYIYYKVAGFSEHDTFRSNQIREGMIDREEAFNLISTENEPRIESIKWYCDTIGIDPIETVKRINSIQSLYG